MRSDSETPPLLSRMCYSNYYVYDYYQAAMAALSKYLLFDLIAPYE